MLPGTRAVPGYGNFACEDLLSPGSGATRWERSDRVLPGVRISRAGGGHIPRAVSQRDVPPFPRQRKPIGYGEQAQVDALVGVELFVQVVESLHRLDIKRMFS